MQNDFAVIFKNSTFGGAISYIGQLSKRDYINFAVQPIFSTKRLSWDELVFSDQWTDYGVFSEQSSAIQPSTNYNVFDVEKYFRSKIDGGSFSSI